MAVASTPSVARGDPALAARLGRELEGEVLFDAFSRGRYSTDASSDFGRFDRVGAGITPAPPTPPDVRFSASGG